VLVYSTKPLAEDMEVTGPVLLELWAKSSAVDTDFTAKLVDVSPKALPQLDRRNSPHALSRFAGEAVADDPDQIYKVTVDLWATSNVFKKGHIMRLEVSSSNFPRFDRNLNTGADQATSRDLSRPPTAYCTMPSILGANGPCAAHGVRTMMKALHGGIE